MDLIIRVTGLCNFDCTFCSAGSLYIKHPTNGVPEQIKDVIRTIKPNSIVVSGGEPLLVDPDYYWELLDIMHEQSPKGTMSITTNLKEFYYHPDKWVDLFNDDNVGITTSFNYGESRRWDKDTPFTEDKFIEIFNLFREKINSDKTLPFIAVIDESNEDTVIKTVELAKRLNTKVRINNATEQGRCTVTYPRYKMFIKYMEILDAGLGDYEIYTSKYNFNACNLNINMLCKSSIRCCYVDTDDKLHYYGCCEEQPEILKDYKNDNNLIPVPQYPPVAYHVNEKCASCELFALCNGCQSQKKHYPPEHCEEMLKLKPKLIKYGWVKEI
jgi:sulfatase maturation enzyme AslB (radical SAM superfamily)